VNRRAFLATAAGTALAGMMPRGAHAAEPAADDPTSWAQFLGPHRDGISRETGLNTDWNARKPKLLWSAPLGNGFSSVSLVGDRLYTMAKREQRDVVVCLDQGSGKEIWAQDGAPTFQDVQRQGAGPRSTPTYHQGKLYCLMPRGDLLCLSAADGKELWRTNMYQVSGAKEPFGEFRYFGISISPLIEEDQVIVQPGGDKDNSVIALHRETGKLLWGAGKDPIAYGSPIAITAAGRRQIIAVTALGFIGIDAARHTVLWRCEMINNFKVNCATPLWHDDVLFVSSGYQGACAGLKFAAKGDKVVMTEQWRNKNLLNEFNTSVVWKGHIYGCHGDRGPVFLRCLDLATGQIRWDARSKIGHCSYLAVDDHLVLAGERGTIQLIEANPEKLVEKGEIVGPLVYKAWSQPALLNKRLYLRDEKQLICLDVG